MNSAELREQIDYLRRSIERKEETISELEHERVPYANEYVEKLKQENKQLKEAINRAIEELKKGLHELDIRRREDVYAEEYLEESIDILEEVSRQMRNYKGMNTEAINKMHDKMMKNKSVAIKSFEDYEVMIQAWREPGMENSKQIIMGDKISIATVICSLMENMILNKIFTIDELYSLVDSVKEVMSDDDRRDV